MTVASNMAMDATEQELKWVSVFRNFVYPKGRIASRMEWNNGFRRCSRGSEQTVASAMQVSKIHVLEFSFLHRAMPNADISRANRKIRHALFI